MFLVTFACMIIYDINDREVLQSTLTEGAEHEQELGKSDFVRLSWESDKKITLHAGSYIVPFKDGLRYRLLNHYTPAETDKGYKYDPEFHHPIMLLGRVPFLYDTTTADGVPIKQQEWQFSGLITDALEYTCKAINEALGITENKFTYTLCGNVDSSVSFSVSSNDILSVLSSITQACKTNSCEWHISWEHRTLYFGQVRINLGEEIPTLKVHGNVQKASVSENKDNYYNCFYPQGSTKNMSKKALVGTGNVATLTRLGLDKSGYPDGCIYVDVNGNIVTKAQFDASNAVKQTLALSFDDVYPHIDLYAYNIRKRVRYLKNKETNQVELDANGKKKTYTIWYMRLAYRTTTKDSSKSLINTTTDLNEQGESVTHYWYDYDFDPKTQILQGYTLKGIFKVNNHTTNGMYDALSQSLVGQPNGQEGFELDYKDINSTIPSNEEEGDSGVNVLKGDYEIKMYQSGDTIIPTNESEGLFPRGKNLPDLTCNIVVLFNIVMGAQEVKTAQDELVLRATKEISRRQEDNNNYSVSSNPVVFNTANPNLYIGQKVIYDDGCGYQLDTRVLKLVTKIDYPIIQSITIGNQAVKGAISQLKEDVNNIMSGNFSGGGLNSTQVTTIIRNYADARYLSKLHDDTASGVITFLRGLVAKARSFFAGIVNEGDIVNTGGITTKDLTVTGQAHFFKLLIDHIKSIGGAYISSPADGFDIAKVEPVGGSEAHPARYRLYWRATDGKRTRANMWEVGDQALSMDFNDAQKGVVMENMSNNYWWSCVLAVSDAAVKTDIDGTEQDCYYIEVSNEGSIQGGVYTPAVNTQGWDAFNKTKDAPMWTGALKPSVGDGVAMLGHRFSSATDQDRRRQSAIYESSYVSLDAGLTAPLKAYYIGIDDFNLSTHRRSYSDAYGSKTVGTFEVVSEGETKPLDEYIAGKAGAVQYRLQTDESVVRIGKDGTMSVTEITPKVVKIENGRVTKTFNADEVLSEGYKITFKTSKDARFHVMEYNHPIALTSDMTMITFHLAARFNSSEVYDTVSIPIIRDGADGGSGYSITCNPASLVFDTNNNGELSASQSKSVSVIVKNGDGPVNITGKVGIEGLVNIAATGLGVTESGVINVNPVHIVVNDGLPATSAGFTIKVTLPDATLYYTIPISVNVSKYISQIKSDAESYKSQFNEFTGGETSMRLFKSEVLQTAREISQEVSEKATGGNNLLKDSEFKRLDSVSLRFPEAISPVKNRGYNGTNAIRISKYGLTENQYIGLFWDKQNVVKVEKGATYTFSFYAMSPNPSAVDNVYNEIIFWDSPSGGRKSQLASMNLQGQLTTAYRLFTQTFTIPENAQYEYIEVTLFSLRNGEVYFARPCLTKTDKHTGWSKSKDDKEYIGGNLIRGAQKFDAAEFQVNGTLIPNGYEDFTILRLNSSCQHTFGAGEIKPDTDYMLSMWVKSSGSISVRFMATNGATETCRLVENSYGQFTTDPYDARDGYSQLSPQAVFTRVWVHFRTRSTVPSQVRLYITGSGELCGMKLEQGADMTAWTDSRETLIFSLKDFTSYIRQSADKIELKVTDGVNKAGLKLGADGGFTATGRNFKFQDSNGNTHLALTEDGKLKGTLIDANSVTADIIAQPFEEYSTTEEFLQGKKYSWVIRSANIFSGSLKTVLTHQLNGAIVNIHNYTTSSIRFRTTGAYQDSGGNIVFGSIVVHIPPGLLFRAMGIRHLDGADMWVGGKAWPYVGLYPLGRVRKSTTSIGGANYMQLTVISQFEE